MSDLLGHAERIIFIPAHFNHILGIRVPDSWAVMGSGSCRVCFDEEEALREASLHADGEAASLQGSAERVLTHPWP